MTLTSEELQWVTDRMKIYDIKYQEIYYEILDHILTAIEVKRGNGDARIISVVFQDVVDTDFRGYIGIEELSKKQEKIYSKHIGGTFSKILRSYFNWKVLTFTTIVSTLAYTLPDNKPMHVVFFVAIVILAFTPLVYTYILISGKVKKIKGKQSLLKGQLISRTYLPGMLLNGLIYFPTFFMDGADGDNGFKLMQYWPLPILMIMLVFFAVLNLSAINLCHKVLNKEAN